MKERFTKIQYNGEKTVLTFTKSLKSDTESTTRESTAAPGEDFEQAWRALRAEFSSICEHAPNEAALWIMSSVIVGEKNGGLSMQLSAHRPIRASNSPINVTTPALYEGEGGTAGLGQMTANQVGKLKRLLEAAHRFLAGQRAQFDLPLGEADEADDDAKPKLHQGDIEDEAEKLVRQAREILALSALHALVLRAPARITEAVHGTIVDDNSVARITLDVFDTIEDYVDPDDGEKTRYPGVFSIESEGARTVWCAVRTSGGVPRLWVDMNPSRFDEAAEAPSLFGPALFAAVRRELELDEPKPESAPEPAIDEEFLARTRPIADKTEPATVLALALHETLLHNGMAIEYVKQLVWDGAEDEQLAGMAVTYLSGVRGSGHSDFQFSQCINDHVEGAKKRNFVEIEVHLNPFQVVIGKGRHATRYGVPEVVQTVRDLFGIIKPDQPDAEVDDSVQAVAGENPTEEIFDDIPEQADPDTTEEAFDRMLDNEVLSNASAAAVESIETAGKVIDLMGALKESLAQKSESAEEATAAVGDD